MDYVSPNKGRKKDAIQCKENSWLQIKENNPCLLFSSHQEFIDYCAQEYSKGLGVYTISANLNLSSSSGNMIKKQLEYAGLIVTPNQTISKILKRMPDFRFKDCLVTSSAHLNLSMIRYFSPPTYILCEF